MTPRIVFVVRELDRHWPDIAAFDEATIEREQARFRRGIENWIVQTYVRTRRALEAKGASVAIADRFERRALCIAHRDDLNRYGDPLHDCFVLGVRADRPPVLVADLEVVQNALQIESPRARWLPHWPQPGLIPRDPARGTRVERAVYMGRTDSVPAWYSDPHWRAEAAAMGIAIEVRNEGWHDYSNVDVLLAHRTETSAMLRNKPASKLVNAWLAGVPAIVAPEPAFEQLRSSDLDFIATTDAGSTLEALRQLATVPGCYRAMAQNATARGREFTVDAVRARWLSLLLDEAIPAFERWRTKSGALPVRYARYIAAMSAQKLAARRFRREERRERANLAA